MRLALAALLSAAVLTPGVALAADAPPAEAQPGIQAVTEHLRNPRSTRFRKVKVTPAGDVCGLLSTGEDESEFMWFKANGLIWVNEGEGQSESMFGQGDPLVKRSAERTDFNTWRACAKGK